MGSPAESFVLFGQLTDTHVVARDAGGNIADEVWVDNNARLAEAVAALDAETPTLAAVLGTGDLTNTAQPEEYRNLAELMAPLTVPFLPIPGNHDDRDLLRSTFPDMPWIDAAHASWVTVVSGVRIIGLDSTIPGLPGAAFDAEREEWLGSVLGDAHDGPTLLTVHHPPFATGVDWMDRSGFLGLDRLTAVLTEHPVDRVLSGHFHRPVTSTIAGIPAQVCLSTVQHVDLDLRVDAPPSLILDPVGYQIHRIAGADIVTHTRYIATGAQRIAPGWARES
ncbi:MAG TPA: phosphodiesterase [Ilumatobacteraceae bacterium]|nr:phosphodiesterase [Ilumatobacteraceae bacterium]